MDPAAMGMPFIPTSKQQLDMTVIMERAVPACFKKCITKHHYSENTSDTVKAGQVLCYERCLQHTTRAFVVKGDADAVKGGSILAMFGGGGMAPPAPPEAPADAPPADAPPAQ
eukprot:TRINITY_DN48319_c0_g1_i1.p1 TRINITY_DN48319_c0_g1~~TRINITY_DN48319_c0_g1_i1.p1  ORF type:complete len:127 (+),score=27.48 TRINITY_DN48319_c0_g1_i1:45-383(+)